jgi:hypothetical protein
MPGIEENVWCDGCGTEITWAPVIEGKRRYCCQDQSGLPAAAAKRLETDEERRIKKTSLTFLAGCIPWIIKTGSSSGGCRRDAGAPAGISLFRCASCSG